jgi:hypothetical protein
VQERRDGFKFNQYLLMTRVYTDPLTTQQGAHAAMGPPAAKPPKSGAKQQQQQQQPAKKQKTQRAAASSSGAGQAPVIVYVRPEDEFFHKHASASFTFPVEGRAVGKDELQPQRLVLLLPASKVTSARCVVVWGRRWCVVVRTLAWRMLTRLCAAATRAQGCPGRCCGQHGGAVSSSNAPGDAAVLCCAGCGARRAPAVTEAPMFLVTTHVRQPHSTPPLAFVTQRSAHKLAPARCLHGAIDCQ